MRNSLRYQLIALGAVLAGLGPTIGAPAAADTPSPTGDEFLVNTTTRNAQRNARIAALPDGRFVVVWEDLSASGPDRSGAAIRFRLVDPTGAPLSPEFTANTHYSGNQTAPAVAALEGGGWVVVWQDGFSRGNDRSSSAIYAQMYSALGDRVGGEFLVNTTTPGAQTAPAVAGLVGGGFVVTWQDASTSRDDDRGAAIRMQRFGDHGLRIGSERLVNTTTDGMQTHPAVSASLDGGFMIVWEDASNTPNSGFSIDIRGQAFDASGTAIGGERLLNDIRSGVQDQPSIAPLAGGGYVLSWADASGSRLSGRGRHVRARILAADGAPQSDGAPVTAPVDGVQSAPSAVGLSDGSALIAWEELSDASGDGSGYAVRMGRLSDAAIPIGDPVAINTTTRFDQRRTAIAASSGERVLTAWNDASNRDGDRDGFAIKARPFNADFLAPHVISAVRLSPIGNPTNADSLGWALDVSEAIVSADAGDFTAGWPDAVLALSTISSTEIHLTLSDPRLANYDGEIELALADDNDIADQSGNPLASLTPSGDDERTVLLDNTPPSPVIVADWPFVTRLAVEFAFAERLVGFDVEDIRVRNARLRGVDISNSTVTLVVDPVHGSGARIRLKAETFSDLAGNPNPLIELLLGSALLDVSGPGAIEVDGETICAQACLIGARQQDRLTFTAVPESGRAFIGWTGDCARFEARQTCRLPMGRDRVVGARFSDQLVANDDRIRMAADSARRRVQNILLRNDQREFLDDEVRIVNVDATGTLGRLSLRRRDGRLTYEPGPAFADLAPGEVRSDRFSYVVEDERGGTSTAIAIVEVRGE